MFSFQLTSTSNAELLATRRQSVNQLRRCGSLMALADLVQTFLVDSPNAPLEEILSLRLPTLWQLLWLEPLGVFRRVLRNSASSRKDFSFDVLFLQESTAGKWHRHSGVSLLLVNF